MTNTYAPGLHLLADFHDVDPALLGDSAALQDALHHAATAAGAHEIAAHFHHFGPGMGVTGMLLLRESHISIHTWPETRLAVIDIFMCGRAAPDKALAVLRQWLRPGDTVEHRIARGQPESPESDVTARKR